MRALRGYHECADRGKSFSKNITEKFPSTPASVKVRAAEAIFNHAAKAIEIEDIEARVAELERAPGSSKPGM